MEGFIVSSFLCSLALQATCNGGEGVGEGVHVEVGVAEEKLVAGAWGIGFVVVAQGSEVDALFGQAFCKRRVTAVGVQAQEKVQAAVLFDDVAEAGEGTGSDGIEHKLALAGVEEAHAVDVFFKVAFVDEARQGELLKVGDGAGVERKVFIEAVGQRHRQHHVADAHGGRKGFSKGVHVDNAGRSIQALQSWDGPPMKAEFAVVVVFDDGAFIGFAGPGKEFVAAADRHGDAGRELVRWADMGDVGSSGT